MTVSLKALKMPGGLSCLGMGLALPFKKSPLKLLTLKACNSETIQISIQSLKRFTWTFEGLGILLAGT